ncbi:Cyclohexadienyl dehydrogenase [Methylophaga frappieri]|uniref:prephenate dehydrogenase n=1 Tax=Methylophaga frappieri (strain ATCC BAA-2434 / DSM 25690 / JAM7) TaxID=754477 RepID=I1YFE7_METFJ|nr:prephenate dehydrogenase/arogenate dehydrogenase family protein [Methylophaga frappieri]AFJ01640.1 Cyclohexadienyl dehydrogenase [Methylophaga frappieri]
MIKRLAVIGVGLIGGSLALALKKNGQVAQVIGYARSEAVRHEALQLGIIDEAAASIADAVQQADMVFVAVPMGAMAAVLAELAPYVNEKTIITDGGSAKQQVIEAAKASLGSLFPNFVPGHPIAGTEKSGPSAAFAELYEAHRVVLTPTSETRHDALEQVQQMWQQVGADVFVMDAEQHDVVLAATSHLPHVLAFNLVGMLAQRDDCEAVLRYAAGGFRDFSRIASSDAIMWRDICLGNREAVLDLLQQYRAGLAQIEAAIRTGDGDYLSTFFNQAKQARDSRFAEPGLTDNSEV